MEKKVNLEKGKEKYDLDLGLQKALAKYHKQVLETDVSKTNSLRLLRLCLYNFFFKKKTRWFVVRFRVLMFNPYLRAIPSFVV
jgi:hypothetical protein